MEIERINENTLKFYISYGDIEERGFSREDIWYNREKGEELFWEMMDEVNDHEDFSVDGPLWIQVQALDKGLEIVVTKAQISKDGNKLELPDLNDGENSSGVTQDLENFMEQSFPKEDSSSEESTPKSKKKRHLDDDLTLTIKFKDIEDVISLSQSMKDTRFVDDRLYAYDNNYYLHIGFPNGFLSEDEQEDYISQLLEYGEESDKTVHYLAEYGTEVMAENALKQLRKHFK
ncbi:adaptor protein MecA [Alkalibacillus haloalkaliphilus]|uniref:Adapter protein MecA n=1 Tax=Alkalibacillus haloalkaliphilus TaxID=94136 RepID=A0A511W3H2_9BACI|nr:adaptor protein MecA [Alkalibacillus haloalkaliphilus]GEN45639.1 adapter protein MecA 1 [Alkalibacillus haloalkaliphilus]